MDADAPSGLTVGPLEVSAEREAVARFAAATRSAGAGVPATFPIVWLTHPAIRAAAENLARPGEVAFHEEQAFDYRAPLVPDAPYGLLATLERHEGPARVVVAARIARDGAPVLTVRTVLRLLDTSAMAASADPVAAAQP